MTYILNLPDIMNLRTDSFTSKFKTKLTFAALQIRYVLL